MREECRKHIHEMTQTLTIMSLSISVLKHTKLTEEQQLCVDTLQNNYDRLLACIRSVTGVKTENL